MKWDSFLWTWYVFLGGNKATSQRLLLFIQIYVIIPQERGDVQLWFWFLVLFSRVLSKRSEMFTFHISTFLTHDLLIFVHLALFNTQTICIIFQLICDPVDIIKSLNVDFELQFLLFIDICQNGGGGSDSPN